MDTFPSLYPPLPTDTIFVSWRATYSGTSA
jgi:hypothetical protein